MWYIDNIQVTQFTFLQLQFTSFYNSVRYKAADAAKSKVHLTDLSYIIHQI